MTSFANENEIRELASCPTAAAIAALPKQGALFVVTCRPDWRLRRERGRGRGPRRSARLGVVDTTGPRCSRRLPSARPRDTALEDSLRIARSRAVISHSALGRKPTKRCAAFLIGLRFLRSAWGEPAFA